MKSLIPFGVVKRIDEIIPHFDFLKNRTAIRNIGYAIQFIYLLRWVYNTFHLYGPVLSYLPGPILIMLSTNQSKIFLRIFPT